MQQKARSAVLVVKNNQILLIERKKAAEPLYYVLPGGGIEEGETPKQAAIREMKEELGVDILVEDITKDSSATDRETWIIRATIKDDAEPVWLETHKQTPENSYRVSWIPVKDLGSLTIFPKGVLDALEA